MKLVKGILQVIPIASQDAAAYPVHYLSPIGEARAAPLLRAMAKNRGGESTGLWEGGVMGPL